MVAAKASITSADVKRQANIVPDLAKTAKDSGAQEKAEVTEEFAYDPASLEDDEPESIEVYLPKDRIPAGEIVYVRNNTHGIVRFTDGYKSDGTFNLMLKPAGDPESIVSIEQFGVLRNPGFQKWWKAGKLTVTNDSNIEPIPLNTDQIEIERHQQFALEGTLQRTMPGSLPLPAAKEVDFSFLDKEWVESHPGQPRPQRG